MQSKSIILGSAITLLGVFTFIGLSSFKAQESQNQYLSLTANMYGNSYEIHIMDEAGNLEKIELNGSPGRKNNIKWKKFIWKKVNEIGKKGYKLMISNEDMASPMHAIPKYSYVFEKEL